MFIDRTFFLNNKSIKNSIPNISCNCDCECHKNISFKTSKNNTQFKKIKNNIYNLKLNQEMPQKQITFNPLYNTNELEQNHNIITTSNKEEDLKTDNNGYILYRNDIKDFDIFLKALHKIKNKNIGNKNRPKSSSLKGINRNNILLNNNKYYKKFNLNNYNSENIFNNKNYIIKNINNNNIYDKKIKKNMSFDNKYCIKYNKDITKSDIYFDKINDTKRTYQLYSDNYKENNFINKSFNKEKYFYPINKSMNQNNENMNINYNDTYYQNTNYILDDKLNGNINHRISPLGHIVDNFLIMLRDKNEHRNKIVKKNNTRTKNYYWYNKYNEDIMIKKRKLEDMSFIDNKLKSNYSCYDAKIKGFSIDNTTKIFRNKRKYPIHERNNKINEMKEMKAKYNEKNIKNKINDNINFSFNNKYFNNQTSTNKENILNNNNTLNKYNMENSKEMIKNSFMNYIYTKKESLKDEIMKNRYKFKEKETPNNYKKVVNLKKDKNIMKSNDIKQKDFIKKKNKNKKIEDSQNMNNKLKIEKFNIIIQDKNDNKQKKLSSIKGNYFLNKSYINKFSFPKFEKNIEIQNISNISYNSNPKDLIPKENYLENQNINNKSKISNETVAEKVRKFIIKKAAENQKKPSLSTKLNLNTDLTLSDSEVSGKELTDINIIERNKNISSETIFCLYNKYNKISILAFDNRNKSFSLQDFSDFDNFEENYNNKGSLFLNVDKNLYIITGKNHDMLYMFDSSKRAMIKLCKLKYNHSNGNLIYYENSLICLSGDFNKTVEIYNIKKNIWNNMPEMIKERSNSGVCVLNNKYILNLFGYNSPTRQYLDNIEYFDKSNKYNSSWKCLECKNFLLKIKNFFCFSNNNKVIIVGGSKYNENDKYKMKYNNNFIKIIFSEKNLDRIKNIKIEELIGKIKDINKNKNYLFLNGGKEFKSNNDIYYEVFDTKYNCHIFKGINNSHDIYYANI